MLRGDEIVFSIAICDDDSSVTELSKVLIGEYFVELNCTVFNDPTILLKSIQNDKKYNIYILDIFMPELSGIELAREIRALDKECLIIFLTSSEEYHRDAYNVEALQYLEKPLNKEMLFHTLNRALKYLGEKKTELLPVQTKAGVRAVEINQIVYVEAFRHVLEIHLRDGSKIETLDSSMTLEGLMSVLSFPPFCVPYRGFIVNLDHAECLEKYKFCMSSGDEIPVPQKQFIKVRQQYSDYLLNRLAKGDS